MQTSSNNIEGRNLEKKKNNSHLDFDNLQFHYIFSKVWNVIFSLDETNFCRFFEKHKHRNTLSLLSYKKIFNFECTSVKYTFQNIFLFASVYFEYVIISCKYFRKEDIFYRTYSYRTIFKGNCFFLFDNVWQAPRKFRNRYYRSNMYAQFARIASKFRQLHFT